MKSVFGWWLAILAWVLTPLALAAGPDIPYVKDFTAVARDAAERKVPIIVMFGRTDCPYCKQLMDDQLKPMLINPETRSRMVMVQVRMGSRDKLKDFSGQLTTHGKFASQHGITLAPTVKFLSPDGQEAAETLPGYFSPDYYGGFLDQRLETALVKIRGS